MRKRQRAKVVPDKLAVPENHRPTAEIIALSGELIYDDKQRSPSISTR